VPRHTVPAPADHLADRGTVPAAALLRAHALGVGLGSERGSDQATFTADEYANAHYRAHPLRGRPGRSRGRSDRRRDLPGDLAREVLAVVVLALEGPHVAMPAELLDPAHLSARQLEVLRDRRMALPMGSDGEARPHA
jgi:hypothetical protein